MPDQEYGQIVHFNGTSYGFIKPESGERDIFFIWATLPPNIASSKATA